MVDPEADQAEEENAKQIVENTEPVESLIVAENANKEDVAEEVEVDEEELKRDKIIEEVLIYSVTQPIEKMEVVEEEIKQKFANIGVNVEHLKTFCDRR